MDRKEEDRIFGEIARGKKLLQELEIDPGDIDPDVVRQLRRDLVAAQNSFAAETAGAWVAVICGDYAVNGQPIKSLLAISRFRGIETSFQSYGFGKMVFTPWKNFRDILGVDLKAESVTDLAAERYDEPDSFRLGFDDRLSAELIELCVFATCHQAEAWLAEQEGVFLEDVLKADLERIQTKLAAQKRQS